MSVLVRFVWVCDLCEYVVVTTDDFDCHLAIDQPPPPKGWTLLEEGEHAEREVCPKCAVANGSQSRRNLDGDDG